MEQTNEMMQDPNRAAYMIAWRDRYIEKLEQIIEGRAQERQMLDCLLFYALFGMARSVVLGTLISTTLPTMSV